MTTIVHMLFLYFMQCSHPVPLPTSPTVPSALRRAPATNINISLSGVNHDIKVLFADPNTVIVPPSYLGVVIILWPYIIPPICKMIPTCLVGYQPQSLLHHHLHIEISSCCLISINTKVKTMTIIKPQCVCTSIICGGTVVPFTPAVLCRRAVAVAVIGQTHDWNLLKSYFQSHVWYGYRGPPSAGVMLQINIRFCSVRSSFLEILEQFHFIDHSIWKCNKIYLMIKLLQVKI